MKRSEVFESKINKVIATTRSCVDSRTIYVVRLNDPELDLGLNDPDPILDHSIGSGSGINQQQLVFGCFKRSGLIPHPIPKVSPSRKSNAARMAARVAEWSTRACNGVPTPEAYRIQKRVVTAKKSEKPDHSREHYSFLFEMDRSDDPDQTETLDRTNLDQRYRQSDPIYLAAYKQVLSRLASTGQGNRLPGVTLSGKSWSRSTGLIEDLASELAVEVWAWCSGKDTSKQGQNLQVDLAAVDSQILDLQSREDQESLSKMMDRDQVIHIDPLEGNKVKVIHFRLAVADLDHLYMLCARKFFSRVHSRFISKYINSVTDDIQGSRRDSRIYTDNPSGYPASQEYRVLSHVEVNLHDRHGNPAFQHEHRQAEVEKRIPRTCKCGSHETAYTYRNGDRVFCGECAYALKERMLWVEYDSDTYTVHTAFEYLTPIMDIRSTDRIETEKVDLITITDPRIQVSPQNMQIDSESQTVTLQNVYECYPDSQTRLSAQVARTRESLVRKALDPNSVWHQAIGSTLAFQFRQSCTDLSKLDRFLIALMLEGKTNKEITNRVHDAMSEHGHHVTKREIGIMVRCARLELAHRIKEVCSDLANPDQDDLEAISKQIRQIGSKRIKQLTSLAESAGLVLDTLDRVL